MSNNLMMFGALAAVAAVSGIGVVLCQSAVRSALCLVLNFFTLALLYFTLQAELLGITQIVVYTGAIMVLFLFVLMLLNLGAPQALNEKADPRRVWGFGAGAALFGLIFAQVVLPLQFVEQPRILEGYGSPEAIGRTLFTGYVWPLEMVSILLVVGIVGAILLAKRRI